MLSHEELVQNVHFSRGRLKIGSFRYFWPRTPEIQSSGKRKVELVELCEKSEEMKVPKIAEEEAPVDPRISMKEQLKTDKGDLANPLDNENRVFFPMDQKLY